MPEVSHSAIQDFSISSSQISLALGSTDQQRESFWNSRFVFSRDPLGPLGLDVVRNEWLLGCLANERYLMFANDFGKTTDLTAVGFLVIDSHIAETIDDIAAGEFVNGKLGPRQTADYHWDVFEAQLGLPRRTFGGTPFGNRFEAKQTSFLWCPSCDQDY